MAFLPLVFLGLYRVLCTGEKRRGCLNLILGYTLVLESHLLSFEIAVLFSALYCLFHQDSFIKQLGAIIKSATVTICLNLGFLVPLIDYMLRHDMWIQNGETENIQPHGLFVPQLFMMFGSSWDGSVEASAGISEDMLIGPGLYVMAAVACFGVFAVIQALYFVNNRM